MYSNYCHLLVRDTIKLREWSRCCGDVGTQTRVCLSSVIWVIWDNDQLSRFQRPESFCCRTHMPPSYLPISIQLCFPFSRSSSIITSSPVAQTASVFFIWLYLQPRSLCPSKVALTSQVQTSLILRHAHVFLHHGRGRNCTCLGFTYNSSVQEDTFPHDRYVGKSYEMSNWKIQADQKD